MRSLPETYHDAKFFGVTDGCNHQMTLYKTLKRHWTTIPHSTKPMVSAHQGTPITVDRFFVWLWNHWLYKERSDVLRRQTLILKLLRSLSQVTSWKTSCLISNPIQKPKTKLILWEERWRVLPDAFQCQDSTITKDKLKCMKTGNWNGAERWPRTSPWILLQFRVELFEARLVLILGYSFTIFKTDQH